MLRRIVDGLLLGCGDAVIGINPALDSRSGAATCCASSTICASGSDIPTQSCVLAHVTTTLR